MQIEILIYLHTHLHLHTHVGTYTYTSEIQFATCAYGSIYDAEKIGDIIYLRGYL